jgi:pimeloyl-ACP methyl ester carboxylesterase
VTALLGSITVPTLVVCGDQDRSYDLKGTQAMADAIINAKLAVIPGCAHNVHLEETDLFNKTVEDFLSGPPRG